MSAPAAKPLPVPDQDSAGFWSAAAEHRLVVQHCDDCDADQLFPRLICTRCHGHALRLRPAAGTGTVYSCTVVRRAPSPAFAADVPYVVALVELAEGPRLMANIVDCVPDDVHIGMTVQVRFDDVAEGVSLPRFRPVAAP
ncbi:Zn-ribbon domain-containing OB-fold protein [Dactylosporangium fulvum]|uniref:OB-fold domain-containing protein n=1 Tax=Dactylosporangium fulvum TaxID=53359 RepID=A0ABY5W8K1_9ACTN|nr:OB-fold domain-containing protein [Dactylosporangium fulvum]UWP85641.1 OB-fold domain-containing protein [Dactylosporangium fulvum]